MRVTNMNKELRNIIAGNLIKYRSAMGLTEGEFADKCGCSQPYISLI